MLVQVWRVLIFLLLSCFWFLLTYNVSAVEFSRYDTLLVCILFALVLAAQVAVWAGVVLMSRRLAVRKPKGKKHRSRLNKSQPQVPATPTLENTLLTLFTVVNLFSLHVCFIISFAALAGWVQFLIFLLAIFIVFQCFQFYAVSSHFAAVVTVVVAVSFLYQVGAYAFSSVQWRLDTQAADIGQATVSDRVKVVEFKKTPNVYFLSFDAMIPAALARKFLGIKNLAYQNFLIDSGFVRFKNAFSDGAGTRQSLNRLLALDPYYYQKLAEEGRQYGFFTGHEQSPFLQIFKANGYTTGTYLRNDYMGSDAGPHIDYYKTQYLFSLCVNHPTDTAATFGFFGYCTWLEKTDWWKPWLGIEKTSRELKTVRTRYVEFLLRHFAQRLDSGGRHFFMAHILTPSHTPQTYDHRDSQQVADERQRYKYNATHETPAVMKQILGFIAANDPQALIYIYSDHGDVLSRYLNDDGEAGAWSKEQTRFFIQDKLGILSSFYPQAACPQEISFLSAQRYVTNSMVARQIIRCLAGGEDPFVREIEYRLLPGAKDVYNAGYRRDMYSYHFEDYLYE